MTESHLFKQACEAIDRGKTADLEKLLLESPELAQMRGSSNETLLIHLIDWPGHKPAALETAGILLKHGVPVDARRDEENGTALSGVICTEEVDLINLFLINGADPMALNGWRPGLVVDHVAELIEDYTRRGDVFIRKLEELFAETLAQRTTRPGFGQIIPILSARSMKASLHFYVNQLGFSNDHQITDENGVVYAILHRGGSTIHLASEMVHPTAIRINVEPVLDFYEALKEAGVSLSWGPKNQPWGMTEISLSDPSGNDLVFFGFITE